MDAGHPSGAPPADDGVMVADTPAVVAEDEPSGGVHGHTPAQASAVDTTRQLAPEGDERKRRLLTGRRVRYFLAGAWVVGLVVLKIYNPHEQFQFILSMWAAITVVPIGIGVLIKWMASDARNDPLRAEVEQTRARQARAIYFLRGLDYLGGAIDLPVAVKGVVLFFDETGLWVLGSRMNHLNQPRYVSILDVHWEEISSISAEGTAQLKRRTTATRLVTLGVFAFATRMKESYLVVTTNKGELIFESDGLTEQELRAHLSTALQAVRQVRPSAGNELLGASADRLPPREPDGLRPDAIEQIRRLSSLQKDGILTNSEFQAQKARLLQEL